MAEKVLGTITRASEGGGMWPDDVALVFTDRRIMVLKAITKKGILASGMFPVVGSLWAVKRLKEQDVLHELPIAELEKQMKYDISLANVKNIEVGTKWYMEGCELKIVAESKAHSFKTLESKERVDQTLGSIIPEYLHAQ